MEDLAFRRLLDLYYTSEKPIPNKGYEIARRIRLPKNERDVTTVLEEFFVLDENTNCWTHKRCDETIVAYQAKAQRNREVGRLGGRPKANPDGNHDETQTVSKRNPNHKPITNNHKPNKEATVVAPPDGVVVSQSVWDEFIAHRKAKKAKVTQLVIDGIYKEAMKANWTLEDALKETIMRNWQSFKADWVQTKTFRFGNGADVATVTTPPPPNQDAALRKIEADRKLAAPMPDSVRELVAKLKVKHD